MISSEASKGRNSNSSQFQSRHVLDIFLVIDVRNFKASRLKNDSLIACLLDFFIQEFIFIFSTVLISKLLVDIAIKLNYIKKEKYKGQLDLQCCAVK